MRRGKLFIVVRFLSCNVRVTRACFAKLNAKAISNVLIRRIEENSYQITDTSSRIKRFLTEFNFANRTNRYKKKRFSSVVRLNNLRLLFSFFFALENISPSYLSDLGSFDPSFLSLFFFKGQAASQLWLEHRTSIKKKKKEKKKKKRKERKLIQRKIRYVTRRGVSRKAMKAYNFLRVAQRRGKNRKKTSFPPDVCGIKWKCLLKKESLPSSGNSITRAVIFSRVINNAFSPLIFLPTCFLV